MNTLCFSCKKEIGLFKPRGTKTDIVKAGYESPTGMSDTDRLCQECLNKIKKTQIINKDQKDAENYCMCGHHRKRHAKGGFLGGSTDCHVNNCQCMEFCQRNDKGYGLAIVIAIIFPIHIIGIFMIINAYSFNKKKKKRSLLPIEPLQDISSLRDDT